MRSFLRNLFAALLLLFGLAAQSATAAPLARVGVGQVYNNVTDCAAASDTYAPSEAAQAYARAHPAAGTPFYGENSTGTVCVLMHTSVPGKAQDGKNQGDHWVRVPKKFVYRAPNDGIVFYSLCNNLILQVQEEVKVQISDTPCKDCAPATVIKKITPAEIVIDTKPIAIEKEVIDTVILTRRTVVICKNENGEVVDCDKPIIKYITIPTTQINYKEQPAPIQQKCICYRPPNYTSDLYPFKYRDGNLYCVPKYMGQAGQYPPGYGTNR
jgi:hypothetical protein